MTHLQYIIITLVQVEFPAHLQNNLSRSLELILKWQAEGLTWLIDLYALWATNFESNKRQSNMITITFKVSMLMISKNDVILIKLLTKLYLLISPNENCTTDSTINSF